LMFPSEFYDCKRYVDTKKLRKMVDIPKGRRIQHILVHTMQSSGYKNVRNDKIPYKTPVCSSEGVDGAFYKPPYGWATLQPVGDCIIVLSNVKN
jgi:hypothetical protein